VLGLKVSFKQDSSVSTTGDGAFLNSLETTDCGNYFLDPPPHNTSYFYSHLEAADNYFKSVSKENFGINLTQSKILPEDDNDSFQLDSVMSYYHPYGLADSVKDKRLAEFFMDGLNAAYDSLSGINFSDYDVIVLFHAGIGQDFDLPFLDPTPEDIPSAYIDPEFLQETFGITSLTFENGSSVSSGIILPETQNHLLYDVAEEIFYGVHNPCEYQFALTGTFSLFLGFAVGLPPLWDTESGKSGVGVFALMDQGSNNGRGVIPAPPDAWTRIYAGWENATVVRPTKEIGLIARDLKENEIVEVDINASEYFLIENRNNWILDGVDFDSLRWKNIDDNGYLPDYATYLIDSTDVVRDEVTGVITSVPNNDMGLPGSGLLIWHIDETKIWEGMNDYSVNEDKEHRGIDLEEGDGAQDIGYPNIFLFTDPTSGLWSDMWFDGNSEYYRANPGWEGQPSFGPDTYPNTRSNNGSDTYIQVNDISIPGDTMTFEIGNSFIADGFPDTTLNIQMFYDFTGDGVHEIIGGADSLWWSGSDSISITPFHDLSGEYKLCVTNAEVKKELVVVEDFNSRLNVTVYDWNPQNERFDIKWINELGGLELPGYCYGSLESSTVKLIYYNKNDGTEYLAIVMEDTFPFPELSDSNFVEFRVSSEITDPNDGTVKRDSVAVYSTGGLSWKSVENGLLIQQSEGLENSTFTTISLADMDLDGSMEAILISADGDVFVLNSNLTYVAGFPVSVNSDSPLLARDLENDEHPEIVVQSADGDIVVLDWKGNELYKLANSPDNALKMLSHYGGKNCIASQSVIWQFQDSTTNNGNEWVSLYHDPTNRSHLSAEIDLRQFSSSKLIDLKRTYNYPNPATEGSTTIRVFVESAERVEVNIYDVAGYFVTRFSMDSPIQGETNETIWDIRQIQSGVYFANVTATKGNDSESKILKIAVVH